jgi:fructoselysine-6-P-deglycase FrlB-like protein
MTPAVIASTVLVGVALSDELRRLHERILRDAVRLSGATMLSASQEAEINQAQFTKQIQMLEGTHKRLAMQPVEFWQWYAVALADAFGMPRELRRAARLDRAVRGRKKHMAQAHIAPQAPRTVTVQLPLTERKTSGGSR